MNREILKLAIPNILTNLSVPLVSLVDLGLMGRMPSSAYIVAIGLGTVVFNFLYWAFGFLRMGTTGLVSQAFGKGDQAQTVNLLSRSIIIAALIGFSLILLQNPIFELAAFLIQAEQEAFKPLEIYFSYRIYAAPATISIFVLSGWLLGMQDSKSVLLIAVLVNGLNALLSFILVKKFGLDVDGVALGTVVAQYTGLIFAIFIIFLKHRINFKSLKYHSFFDPQDWKEFFRVNFDIFIRTLCLILVMSFFKVKLTATGILLGAANILLFEFITISAYGIDGFAFAAESLCGKYFGKKDGLAFLKAVRISFYWGVGLSMLLSLAYLLFGKHLLQLLTNKEDVVLLALDYLPWLIIAPLINSFAFIWDGIYIGSTATKQMRNSMILATFFIFFPAFALFKNGLGNHGIWLAFSIFMFSRGLIQTLIAKKAIFNRLR